MFYSRDYFVVAESTHDLQMFTIKSPFYSYDAAAVPVYPHFEVVLAFGELVGVYFHLFEFELIRSELKLSYLG